MISGVAILDLTGQVIVLKTYRKDFNLSAFENYRLSVIEPNDSPSPAVLIDGNSFLCHKERSVYYVACTHQNADSSLIFEILNKMPKIFAAVFEIPYIDESNISNYIIRIVELLDEMIDAGYPQVTEPAVLKLLCPPPDPATEISGEEAAKIATGPIPWRPVCQKYKQQKAFVDIIEKFSLVRNYDGSISNVCVEGYTSVDCNVNEGTVCTFTFNGTEIQDPYGETHKVAGIVDYNEIIFHKCVNLDKLNSDNEISFVPQNGRFQMMRYRKTEGISQPFDITPTFTTSGDKIELTIKVQSTYDKNLKASPFVLTIPMSQMVTNITMECSDKSKAKYDEMNDSVVWTIPDFIGKSEAKIHIHAVYLSSQYKSTLQTMSFKPMSAEFSILKLSPTGLIFSKLELGDKKADIYVKYTTKNGSYLIKSPFEQEEMSPVK